MCGVDSLRSPGEMSLQLDKLPETALCASMRKFPTTLKTSRKILERELEFAQLSGSGIRITGHKDCTAHCKLVDSTAFASVCSKLSHIAHLTTV